MHIISREANESILIGEHTVVKVLEVFGDRVKLSIETPGAEPAYWEKVVYLDQSVEAEELESVQIGG
ncbi:carbon storage regulator [Gimesia alba]|jgi:carbon storage regulator CsrA|uniref:Carbon storage regulator n=2 Tax=Gimesia TaxID=1649453 RepID=A0A518IHV4_9PLAN|nr:MULTISPECIES: carbon storage regulator [Gimesia]QDT44544.1 carbon storage regulator [Gimesia alba]QDV52671.1 carbon storage regulator [Gimesia fumaroli]